MLNLIETIDSYSIRCGEKIAHVYRDNKITYKELVEKSDALANYLISEYGEDKTPIVVFGHKQSEMLISFLACVKAGHSYIPIDSSLPSERIRDIIDSSKSYLILEIDSLKENINDIKILSKDDISNIISNSNGEKPNKRYCVKENETYYIIYTSGSTGKPKGVQITLSCLESFVKWGLGISNPDNQEVFMNQAPFSFDLSVMDLYLALASGSTLHSVDKKMIAELRELFSNFKESQISTWVSTPSFAEMCLADSSFNKDLLPKLKLMLFCGETLSNTCVKKIQERFVDCKIINTYGPTEATVAMTSVVVDRELNENSVPLPVGKVKENCKVIIVDDKMNEMPIGEKGEIIIAGDNVSIGYYNNEENTKKAFYTININGREQRAYRTGDEGYIKNDMLYFSGRIDFQVKVNGFRIELEDIENNLRNVEFINNAVVLPIMHENKVQYLSAFVTLNEIFEEKEFKIAMKIKNELKKYVPDYMVPRKIVIKDKLPMTTNGKVNRKSLMEEIQ